MPEDAKPASAEPRYDQMVWVGIGASAGGLEALRELAKHLPPDAPATYIVAQHMAPRHRSLLAELIGRDSGLAVSDVVDGIEPEPNQIYVTPPNHDVIVTGGMLRLIEPSQEPAAPKPSVDRFFRSLAEQLQERAIGVILSGTGSDGAYGVQAIRAAGGVTIVQDAATAKYNGMPSAAEDTGCVDIVLSPEQIGMHFAKIARRPRDLALLKRELKQTSDLDELLQIVLSETRIDFREYKEATIQRRVERRMVALGMKQLADYVAHARHDPGEVEALFRDLMISVTSFFRDPEEFDALRPAAQELVDRAGDDGLRVWAPGCATGEEAYSIAMLLAEAMGGLNTLDRTKLQIFATDIDERAIVRARRGVYPEATVDTVPENLLSKYFEKITDGYSVNKSLRDLMVFSSHNVCKDPPFLNIDLISCRNVMIYFQSPLQERVLAGFHYALNPNGLLFLGKSESVFGSEDLFRAINESGHIFRRRASIQRAKWFIGAAGPRGAPTRPTAPARPNFDHDVSAQMFSSLVKALGPNAILVTSDHEVRRAYGDLRPYTTLASGELKMNTASLLTEDYRHEARVLVSTALRTREPQFGMVRRTEERADAVADAAGGASPEREQVRVYPIACGEPDDLLALVVFSTWRDPTRVSEQIAGSEQADGVVAELERELAFTRESLQRTVEQLETSNEELQALNEELQSSNQELQSTNEELETSNEELQSTNEELTTVNEELHVSSQELTIANQDLDNVLAHMGAPLLVVDRHLRITRISKEAERLFKVAIGAVTPHVSVCQTPPGFPNLGELLADVVATGARCEVQVRAPIDETGAAATFRSAQLTAVAYYTPKGQLVGAVMVVVDNTTELQRTQRELQLIFDRVPAVIMRRDAEGRVMRANKRASDVYGAPIERIEGARFDAFAPKAFSDTVLREDKAILEAGRAKIGTISRLERATGETIWLRRDCVPFVDPESGERSIFSLSLDITAERAAEMALRESEERFDLAVRGAGLGLWDLDLASGAMYWSDRFKTMIGVSEDGAGRRLADLLERVQDEDRAALEAAIDAHLTERKPFDISFRLRRADGAVIWLDARGQAFWAPSGEPRRLVCAVDDVTERRASDRALREKSNLMELAEEMGQLGHWRIEASDLGEDVASAPMVWSPQLHALFGPIEGEPRLGDMLGKLGAEDAAALRAALTQSAAGGAARLRVRTRSADAGAAAADGARIVETVMRLEEAPSGGDARRAIFGVARDITDLERERAALQTSLEKLKAANAELERFSYVCSHDMKEPVRLISNLSDILLDPEADDTASDQKEFLTRINRNAKHLLQVISNLLAFSRMQSTIERVDVDLAVVLADVADTLHLPLEEHGVTLDIGPMPVARGARVHFRQLFQNLVGNAIRFAGKRGDAPAVVRVRAAIETERAAEHDLVWASFTIEDNGPGVPEAERERIFDAFQRLEAVEGESGGSGLGLWICRKLARQYGGDVACDESPDFGGARFTVAAPIVVAAHDAALKGETA